MTGALSAAAAAALRLLLAANRRLHGVLLSLAAGVLGIAAVAILGAGGLGPSVAIVLIFVVSWRALTIVRYLSEIETDRMDREDYRKRVAPKLTGKADHAMVATVLDAAAPRPVRPMPAMATHSIPDLAGELPRQRRGPGRHRRPGLGDGALGVAADVRGAGSSDTIWALPG